MKNLSIHSRRAVAAFALTLLVFSQSLPPATSASALPVADLTAEIQTLTSFTDGLTGLEKKVIELQKKPSITSIELNSVKTNASTLKTKVSPTQLAVQSIIRKLKAAGEWEKYDSYIEQENLNSKLLPLIRENGGAKKILEDAAARMSEVSTEIDGLVQPLSSKIAVTGFSVGNTAMFGFVAKRASFTSVNSTAASAAARRRSCLVRLTIYVVKGGIDNMQRAACACDQDQTSEEAAFCATLY